MRINEDTYAYIDKVTDQIEGLTCALITHVENAGGELESYHYKPYQDFGNIIRDRQIDVSKEIKEKFEDVRYEIEDGARIIKASETSKFELHNRLLDVENVFAGLIIRSENIRELSSDTSNPIVPDAAGKVYKAYSGYNKLLEQYVVESPNPDNYSEKLLYSFFETVRGMYEKLFKEYDSLLSDFGQTIDDKRRFNSALSSVYKKENAMNLSLGALRLAQSIVTTHFDAGKSGAEKFADHFINAVDYVGKINSAKEKQDNLKDGTPKKSLARKVIKKIATVDDAIKASGDSLSGGAKILAGVGILMLGKEKVEQLQKSKAFGLIGAGFGFGYNTVKLVGAVAIGDVRGVIKHLPKVITNGCDLIEKTLIYVDHNNIHFQKFKDLDDMLYKHAARLKQYNRELAQYKIDRNKGLKSKKPNAPPYITAKNVCGKLCKGISLHDSIFNSSSGTVGSF